MIAASQNMIYHRVISTRDVQQWIHQQGETQDEAKATFQRPLCFNNTSRWPLGRVDATYTCLNTRLRSGFKKARAEQYLLFQY